MIKKTFAKIAAVVPEGLQRSYLAKAFGSFSISQAISAVVNFSIVAMFTRYLSPSEYGRISLIWMFIIIASMMIDGRLNTAFSIRYYKSSREENITNMYSIFVFNAVIFAICYLLCLLFPSIIEISLKINIRRIEIHLIYFIILFMLIFNFYANLLIISQKPKEYLIANVIFSALLSGSIAFFLVVMKLGYISYLYAYLSAYIGMSIIAIRYLLKEYRPALRNLCNRASLRTLLRISLPLIPAGLSLVILTWANRYLLNIYVGLSVVGIFTVGYRFSEILDRFVSNPFGQAITPMLYKKYAEDIDMYKKVIQKIFKYYWVIISGIIIIYLAVLREFFGLAIGQNYMQGYFIVPIILLSIALWGATGIVHNTVVLREKTKNLFFFTGATVLVNIVLNIVMIPPYGMYGAALATFISYSLQYAMIVRYAQKLLYVPYEHSVMIKSLGIMSVFASLLVGMCFVRLTLIAALLVKTSTIVLFLIVLYKVFSLKEDAREILNYTKTKFGTMS